MVVKLAGRVAQTILFLPQKTEKPSLEIPQPSSSFLREKISISLQIFYGFFLNPLQIQIVTKYRSSRSRTKRASPHSCSFAICSALKNLLMPQINFGKVTSQ